MKTAIAIALLAAVAPAAPGFAQTNTQRTYGTQVYSIRPRPAAQPAPAQRPYVPPVNASRTGGTQQ